MIRELYKYMEKETSSAEEISPKIKAELAETLTVTFPNTAVLYLRA